MDTISYGIDVSPIQFDSAAASNQFFETTASPDALSSISRGNTLIRDLDQPIRFPFAVEYVTSPA